MQLRNIRQKTFRYNKNFRKMKIEMRENIDRMFY